MIADHKLDCMLLHGWGVTNTVWDRFAEDLNPIYHIVTPCLYSVASKTKDYSFESMAMQLNETITHDCVVVAWSMGGLLAMRLAALTDKIKAIIFIASPPCFVNKEGWKNTIDSKTIIDLQRKLLSNPVAALEYFGGLIAHGEVSAKNTIRTIRKHIANEKNSAILSCWLMELLKHDQRNKFVALNIPTQTILGEHDVLVRSQIEKQIKQLKPDAQCAVMKNCGHAPFVSQPEEIVKLINEFISAQFKQK